MGSVVQPNKCKEVPLCPNTWLDQIIKGDCIKSGSRIPDASVDLIFADPPYNLQLKKTLHRPDSSKVDAVSEQWDRFESFNEYDNFTRNWLLQARRVLKPNGSLWVIGTYHNIFRVGAILQDLGFWIINDVIWRKSNPMPNFRGRRFANAHETLIWAVPSKRASYTFNYAAMKAMNDDVQMRSDWLFSLCTGGERAKNADGRKAHPTQKPLALLTRILLACSNVGDVVMDPFMGSGTTAVAAKMLRRKFTGFELDTGYIACANQRIEEARAMDLENTEHLKNKASLPRIGFGTFVESGVISAGDKLRFKPNGRLAKVRLDGSLQLDGQTGSIHKIGAYLMNSPSCNGWQHWQFWDGKKWQLIDDLRQAIYARIAA